MKKSAFVFLLFMLLSSFVMAQVTPPGVRKPNRAVLHARGYQIAIAPTVGFGLALGSESETYNSDLSIGYGYHFGLAVNARFGNRRNSSFSGGEKGHLGVELAALYENRIMKVSGVASHLKCIEIPIVGQYYPINSLCAEAGVTLVKFMEYSPEWTPLGPSFLHTGQIKGGDIMLTVGASYDSPIGLAIGIRYYLGCSNIAGNFDSKVSTAMVSLTYLLRIIK